MNAQDYREQYAHNHGYEEWGLMRMDSKDFDKLEDDAMNAFAAHKIEEARNRAKEVTEDGRYSMDFFELNNIFDEILKDLK